jgi:hypothetical protein
MPTNRVSNYIFFVPMKILFSFLLLLCISHVSFGQILDNTEGQTFGDEPYFNEQFVRRNKIKRIKGFYSSKASMDVIRKSKDIYQYDFDEQGRLIKEVRTQFGDTLVSMFEYGANGELAVTRKSDNYGFHSYHFEYDEKNRVIRKEYRRDVNKNGDKYHFELDRSFIVSEERFEYIELEGKNYKMRYLNNAGKVYKEEIYFFNEFDLLVKQEGRLIMGSGITNVFYSYDEMGRVTEKTVEKKLMGDSKSVWKYEYDEHDNLLAQHYYKNDVYLKETQIVYKQETLLLDAFVNRETENDFVTILQFKSYDFYDE